jgi:hypothetical protein
LRKAGNRKAELEKAGNRKLKKRKMMAEESSKK